MRGERGREEVKEGGLPYYAGFGYHSYIIIDSTINLSVKPFSLLMAVSSTVGK